MTNMTSVFGLELSYGDDEGDDEEAPVIPTLSIFQSAAVASQRREGLDIEEGDLYFFAADGSPLKAEFSQKPYVDNEKNKYFAGVYALCPGSGDNLPKALAKILGENAPPQVQIIVYKAEDDEDAQWYGWLDRRTMEEGIKQALRILPLEQLKRIKLE